MKPKFSLLAVVVLAAALALVGVLRDVSTSKAVIPLPVQPFLADAQGGVVDTTLGTPTTTDNYTVTVIPRGSRLGMPWIFTGPGVDVMVDKDIEDGTDLGSITSELDALCDSTSTEDVDVLCDAPCSSCNPVRWYETTTLVEGTVEEYLKEIMPPFSWLLRHRADITNLCLFGVGGNAYPTANVLNTIYTNIPWSVGGAAFVTTTVLGGDPIVPPSDTCLDSPQSSVSITNTNYPTALEGDSDGPCDTDDYQCADAAIYGMWTDNVVELDTGQSQDITVEKVKLNNGPETGNFSEHWEIELTNPGIMTAAWGESGADCDNDVDDDGDTVVNDGCPPYDPTADEDDCSAPSPPPETCDNDTDDGAACDGSGTDGADYADSDCQQAGAETACNDDIDDDEDDVVNDGCPAVGATVDEPVTLVKSEPDEQSKDLEITCTNDPAESGDDCNNDIDDDGDTLVNDGCQAVNNPETGAQCANAIDDEEDDPADGVVNDGCPAAGGEGLVVLKNILWPIPPTKDTYADDNAFVFVVKVICDGVEGVPLVDKEVIWIKPVNPEEHHLQLALDDTVIVTLDELKASHYAEPETGDECDNADDDDSDGWVNDGCPAVGVAELGSECDNAIDENSLDTAGVGHEDDDGVNPHNEPVDDGDGGAVNDGCPARHNVPGHEWLVAEVSDVDGVTGDDIEVSWDTSVTVNETPVTASTCSAGNACIEFDATEPHGQSDVLADLSITCPDTTVPGLYSVVIKAIDVPVAPYGESKPSDNAQRSVIKVWCGVGDGADDPDTVEDATGLHTQWTIFESEPDARKDYQSPPSLRSDNLYVERIVDLRCYWLDEDGCYTDEDNTIPCDSIEGGGDISGYHDPEETWNDYDLLALCEGEGEDEVCGIDAVDSDGDCLMDPKFAQPSHAVDELDEPTGTLCEYEFEGEYYDHVPFSEKPNLVAYNEAADQDCDGLVDGIEKAWGSNPQLADSDGDGASDFVEMFQFSNPLNPDTDGDGLKDKPEDDYGAEAAGGAESGEDVNEDDNCPGIYNPDQANYDGQRRPNGSVVPGEWASNPMQDRLGDACDDDDDNDMAPDAYEVTTAGTSTAEADYDGDTVIDGYEVLYETDPLDADDWPDWSADAQKYGRGCHHNEPAAGSYGPYTDWDEEQDGTSGDDVEKDLDGDDLNCPGDNDSDNGSNTGAAAMEYPDLYEMFGHGTHIGIQDSDGDECADWIEITDVNGDRYADITDVYQISLRAFAHENTGSDKVLDVNKDTYVDITDVYLSTKNSGIVKKTNYYCDENSDVYH